MQPRVVPLAAIPSPANKAPAQSFNGNLGLELGVSILIGLRK